MHPVFCLKTILTQQRLYSILQVGKRQAGVAQVVAHLIGSEEVTSSTLVASYKKTSANADVFLLYLLLYLKKILNDPESVDLSD